MPVIKSAKKKLRKDKKREFRNQAVKNTLRSLLKQAKIEKSEKAILAAIKAADKAVKKHILHKNKAARLKSGLTKLIFSSKPAK